MLSILIPVFNYDVAPLVKALATELDLMDAKAEILIQDDGSTGFKEENQKLGALSVVRYQENNTNLGRSATRQILARQAQFDQLLFLDADVVPTNPDFLRAYLAKPELAQAIGCGGVSYAKELPTKEQMLRYVYGTKRESQPAITRQQHPHMVLASNLWIQKELFLKLNDQLDNFYGDDLVLSQKIRDQKIKVIHLDNPVVHLGLESSEDFLEKTTQMVGNLVRLEAEGVIAPDLMRLQRAYLSLKAKGMLKPFYWGTSQLVSGMRRNLLSETPSMKTFDAYKLHQYIKMKSHG